MIHWEKLRLVVIFIYFFPHGVQFWNVIFWGMLHIENDIFCSGWYDQNIDFNALLVFYLDVKEISFSKIGSFFFLEPSHVLQLSILPRQNLQDAGAFEIPSNSKEMRSEERAQDFPIKPLPEILQSKAIPQSFSANCRATCRGRTIQPSRSIKSKFYEIRFSPPWRPPSSQRGQAQPWVSRDDPTVFWRFEAEIS